MEVGVCVTEGVNVSVIEKLPVWDGVRVALGVGRVEELGVVLGVDDWARIGLAVSDAVSDSDCEGVGTCDATTWMPRNWNVDVMIAVAAAPAAVPMRYTAVPAPDGATQ